MPRNQNMPEQPRKTRLRILQTTDLHMHLLPFDYDLMVPATDRSFAHLRALITEQRADGVPTVLCDTGDFLQGNAMADVAAAASGPHPMIKAFNELQYDAIVLGNHDFDYGLPTLHNALSGLTCPALAANIDLAEGPALAASFTVVPVETPEGILQVGLLGLTVPPTPLVDPLKGPARMTTYPPVEIAKGLVKDIREQGADVIVALCHFGIDPNDTFENVAADIAAVPGIDVVLAGHTHDVFPSPKIPATDVIDPIGGTLHGKPAVMAGAFGRYLGVIELQMLRSTDGWTVETGTSRVIQPVASPVPPPLQSPGLLALHDETLVRLHTQIATTEVPLSNQFSMIAPDMSQQVLAEARMRRIKKAVSGTSYADLPLLASAAPYRAGNKDAPAAFLRVTPGPVILNDVIGIYPYQDRTIGLLQTGAQIRDWLERTACRFAQITRGDTTQPLLDPKSAPYDLSSIFGLTYQIDPSQPIGSRISDIRFDGKRLQTSDRFVVATTPYRHRRDKAAGQSDIIVVTDETSQDILQSDLSARGTIRGDATPVWQFAPLAQTAADFWTSAETPFDLPANVSPVGQPSDGLQRYTIRFS